MNQEALFDIDEDSNSVTIKIIDKTTKEVIKVVPADKTLELITKAWELADVFNI